MTLTSEQLELLVEGFYNAINEVECETITYEDAQKALTYALQSHKAKWNLSDELATTSLQQSNHQLEHNMLKWLIQKHTVKY